MVNSVDNPYVGPQPFAEKDSPFFFGREREARELLSLVISEPLVLFYAPSGAGKSSLINTRLIPSLRQEGFNVLPIGRVSGKLAEGTGEVKNIFVFNLLLRLDQGGGEHLTQTTLTEYLQAHPSQVVPSAPTDDDTPPARVLIIDQFEEIVTTHLDRWPEREGFFQQLRQAQADDPLLWVVLTMREDYIAPLEPYIRLLPGKLRIRFRMPQMSYQAALEAVKKPAEQGGRPFAPGVAESLVDNLRQIRVQTESLSEDTLVSAASNGGRPSPARPVTPEGGSVERVGDHRSGQFVEPVQLQVVCYQLWKNLNLKERPSGEITQADLEELGNVNLALAQFYEQALAKALQETGVSEIFLRQWFEHKLITEAGTRGTVYRGPEKTEGLANQAVEVLANQYLLRAEIRSGGTWYELVHDRLIEPILQANREWWLRQSPLVQAAQAWEDAGRDKSKLYRDQQLKDALANVNREALEPLVEEFLVASEEAERAWLARRSRELIAVLLIVLLIVGGMATYALIQSQRAQTEAAAAEMRRETAEAAQAMAIAAQATAEARREAAEAAQDAAVAARATAEARREVAETAQAETDTALKAAKSSQLANQALNFLDSQLDLALLLSLEANRITETVEARGSLLHSLEHNPHLTTFLRGHTGQVNSVTFSPLNNGHTLASASDDHTIILWDVSTNPPISRTLTLTAAVKSVAFSPDGQTLASASSDDSTITLWDVDTGQPIGSPLTGHILVVNSVAFSPLNGQILASASDDGTIILWNVDTAPSLDQTLFGHTDPVNSVAFSPDGQTLASGGVDGQIILWDVATGQPIGSPLTEHTAAVKSVSFSPDGQTLASAGEDGTMILWEVDTGQPLDQPLAGQTDPVNSLAFSPDGQTLASGGIDGQITLWDVATGQPIGSPPTGSIAPVNSVAFSLPNGQTLASGNADGTVILWDITARQRLGQPLIGHTDWVNNIAFSPAPLGGTGHQVLASGSDDQTIILWDVATSQPIGPPLTDHKAAVFGLAFSPNGQMLASGGDDGTIILWDVASDPPTSLTLTGHTAAVYRVAFSPDGQIVASGSADQTIILWDVDTGQPLDQPLTGHADPVNSVAFNPDGQTLASGSDDGTIILWRVATGQPISSPLIGHTASVLSVVFSPDGQMLASGSADQTIILWDAATRQPIGPPLTGHIDSVFSVVFSPDGQMLASGSADQTIILWNMATRQPIGPPLTGHTAAVNSVTFSPEGQRLASGSADSTIILWEVNFGSWQDRACSIANRNLTVEEWKRYFQEEAYHPTCPDLPIPPNDIGPGQE